MKRIVTITIALFSVVFLAVILQFAAFALPVGPMEDNVKKSVEIFKTEGSYRCLVSGMYTTLQDNYTDAAMLMQAIYEGDEPFIDRVMNVYCNMSKDKNYAESLILYCESGQSQYVHSYYWYWHGYLIFLKPLLLFLDYGNIRLINSFVQILLSGMFVYTLFKKGCGDYFLPFAMAFFIITAMVMPLSLQFSSCFYIMLISSIILMNNYDKLKKANCFYILFFLTGIATSFFDLLTYPLVTVGIPLLLLFIMNENYSVKYMLWRFMECCFFWGIGYILFWVGKWAVASIFLRRNCFVQGISKILLHTTMDAAGSEGPVSSLGALNRNFMWMEEKAYLVILTAGFIYLLFTTIRMGISRRSLMMCIPIFVIALFPIGWYMLASTHAYYHYWMEYRHCVLLIAAFFSLLVKCRRKRESVHP